MNNKSKKNPSIYHQDTKVELSCRAVRCILVYFEEKYGRVELQKFIEGTNISLEYLEDENNWISYSYFNHLLESLVDYTKDTNSPFEAGTYTYTQRLIWTFMQPVLGLFGNPASVYKMIARYNGSFNRIAYFKTISAARNKVVIELCYFNGFKQTRNNCMNIQGQLASITKWWGLPLAKVKEQQCAAQGADSCVYEVSWPNRTARLTGMLGLVLGGVLAGLTIKLTQGIFISGMANYLMIITFPLIGYLIDKLHDYGRTLKENTRVSEEWNDSLVKSLEEIEKLNLELQKRVEQRTAELNLSNQELEKALIDLKNSQERLVQSEKMASIGVLAAGMAHELNNPVAAIRASLQDVLEDTPEDDLRWEALKGAEKSTDRCRRIISDLLTFSRESKDLRLQGINDIVDGAVSIAQKERTNPGIKISKALASDLPKLNLDALQIRQVLMNLISNASQAIKEEGEVIIRTCKDNGNIKIEVSDTGEGIPKDIQKTIFDPFFTTKAPGAGMGLGLSISYSIIKRYNGDIEVRSEEGRGSTFTIALPVEEMGR